MKWGLIAIKGDDVEFEYFRNNHNLKNKAKRIGVTLVSTLDTLNNRDPEILDPLHEFLNYNYPFYASSEHYQHYSNELTRSIVDNFGNPDYMDFFFKELKVVGPNGPYAIIFGNGGLVIKYLGKGPWQEYGLCQYLINKELVPPQHWETDNRTKSITLLSRSHNPQNFNGDNLNNANKIQVSKYLDFDDEINESRNFIEKLDESLDSVQSEVSQEALRLLEYIRENELQKGFQELVRKMHSYKRPSKFDEVKKFPGEKHFIVPKITITNEFKIFFPFGELELEPLHKALYLLFLKVPDGISLYSIGDYSETLKYYYFQLSNSEDPIRMEHSINLLANRYDNSLYEKISRINKTLKNELSQFGVDYGTYSIIGKRGKPKRILAAKDLVTWED
jgi:hypothetical protein